MKMETLLKLFLDISREFENCDKEKTSKRHFEALHVSISELVRGFTREQYEDFPEHTRNNVKQLEKEIFSLCSDEYKQTFQKHIKENGWFRIAENKNESRIKTKCKTQIGFIKEEKGNSI